MNITVEFLGPIEQSIKIVQADTLQELSNILKKDTNVGQWLETSAIAVNDKIIKNINFKLSQNDKVSILPPVCGG